MSAARSEPGRIAGGEGGPAPTVALGRARPRAALVGNPSDLYGGRVISFTFTDFVAEVEVRRGGPELTLEGPGEHDVARYESVEGLHRHLSREGYGPACPLLEATVTRWAAYLLARGAAPLPARFDMRALTTIPREMGLGGSSAIVTAAVRALSSLCGVDVPRERLPGLVLSVETEELGIVAGLQDRVAQAYGGLVYMDLDPAHLARHGQGRCERLEPLDLPPLYVAWRTDGGEPSSAFHSALRRRHEEGDREIDRVMDEIASLAARGRHCIARCEHRALGWLVDRNLDLRRTLADLDPRDVRLVEVARAVGASANLAGSGGAVAGTYAGPAMLAALRDSFEAAGCGVVAPRLDG